MPQRIPSHQPARTYNRPHPSPSELNRPNAARRGYCSKKWFAIRQKILLRDAYTCQECGRVCSRKQEATVDHIVPKSKGGTDEPSNLQCLCLPCNSRKGDKTGEPLR